MNVEYYCMRTTDNKEVEYLLDEFGSCFGEGAECDAWASCVGVQWKGLAGGQGRGEVAYAGSGGREGLHGEHLARTNLDHEPVRVVEEHLLNGHARLVDGLPRVLDAVLLQCLLHSGDGVTLEGEMVVSAIDLLLGRGEG